jgi:hypothetical protein
MHIGCDMIYPYSLANYPTSFKGTVVSPTKICIQFNDVNIKLRLHDTDRELLQKAGPNSDRVFPIGTLGTDVMCVAVGCQMPIVEDYQMALIDAYEKYNDLHVEKYKETYGKEFKDFILRLKVEVDRLVREVTK